MLTHINPSFFPFFIAISLLLFFISLVFSILLQAKLVFIFFIVFFVVSVFFSYNYISEHDQFSSFQFFVNTQYFYFFIFGELCFFGGIFWAIFWYYFTFDSYNMIAVSASVVSIINPFYLPLFNTLLLLTSAVFITIYHESFGYYISYQSMFNICIYLGLIFLLVQCFEFYSAGFSISGCCFGSLFFFSTGFHGFHVFVGLLFFTLYLWVHTRTSFYSNNFLTCACLYWHFVDVVWLFLLLFLYLLFYLI